MGSSQSAHMGEEEEEDDEEEEEEEEEMRRENEHEEDEDEEEEEDELLLVNNNNNNNKNNNNNNNKEKKVLEQEPEMLPCHASASPLSPQLSSLGTPRLLLGGNGPPSIKVWDPYNVLLLNPPPPHYNHLNNNITTTNANNNNNNDTSVILEVMLINHGEWHMNLRPDLVSGRCPEAALTPTGKRQARALGVFLNSQHLRFNAVYSSPLDRARSTALSVCQEMKLGEEQIQSSEALIEISLGHWEGGLRSEIYTPEILNLIDRFQPDFSPPSGESLRQVEFRMVQFLNESLLRLPEKFRSDFSPPSHNDNHEFSHHKSNSIPQWDLVQRHQRQGLSKKKSGKSRLQIVTTTGDHEADDEMSPREPPHLQNGLINGMNTLPPSSSSVSSSCIGVFTHSVPIKCLLAGLLGCSAASNKLCVEDSSVTVLQHSWKTGWQIKRLNDTAHLRLL